VKAELGFSEELKGETVRQFDYFWDKQYIVLQEYFRLVVRPAIHLSCKNLGDI